MYIRIPMLNGAAVLYLTPDAPIDSGTGIYDGVDSDMNIAVGNKYNGWLHIAESVVS